MIAIFCDRCKGQIAEYADDALSPVGKICGEEGEVLFHIEWETPRSVSAYHLCRCCAAKIVRATLLKIFSEESKDGAVPPMLTTAERP